MQKQLICPVQFIKNLKKGALTLECHFENTKKKLPGERSFALTIILKRNSIVFRVAMQLHCKYLSLFNTVLSLLDDWSIAVGEWALTIDNQ